VSDCFLQSKGTSTVSVKGPIIKFLVEICDLFYNGVCYDIKDGERKYEVALEYCSTNDMHIISGLFEEENRILWEFFADEIEENGGSIFG